MIILPNRITFKRYLKLSRPIRSLLRDLMHERLKKIIIKGSCLDVGGGKLVDYRNIVTYLEEPESINFDTADNRGAVVYNSKSGSATNSVNYIYGSTTSGYEYKYGFTVDADITFPSFNLRKPRYDKTYISSSLFGMVSASINDDVGTTWASTDSANFDVYFIRDRVKSKNENTFLN